MSGDVVRDNQRGAIRYREQILSSLGKDVLENGGEISINGNGDIILSFQSDDTYDLSLDVTSISEID